MCHGPPDVRCQGAAYRASPPVTASSARSSTSSPAASQGGSSAQQPCTSHGLWCECACLGVVGGRGHGAAAVRALGVHPQSPSWALGGATCSEHYPPPETQAAIASTTSTPPARASKARCRPAVPLEAQHTAFRVRRKRMYLETTIVAGDGSFRSLMPCRQVVLAALGAAPHTAGTESIISMTHHHRNPGIRKKRTLDASCSRPPTAVACTNCCCCTAGSHEHGHPPGSFAVVVMLHGERGLAG